MNIVQGRGSSSAVNIFIRGIGQPDALQTFDPGVGMYVDDVYYSRIQGALISLFDVDHVEVLRGPQGTLYGKNSTGGAVKIVTENPSDAPTGSVEATVRQLRPPRGQVLCIAARSTRRLVGLASPARSHATMATSRTRPPGTNTTTTTPSPCARSCASTRPRSFDAMLTLDYTQAVTRR